MRVEFGFYPLVFLLALARITALIGGSVVFGRTRIPPRIRIAISFSIALLLAPVLPAEWSRAAAAITTIPALALAILNEVLMGMAIALICDMILAVCHLAGFVIGYGSSLSISQSFDPVNGVSGEIVGQILQLTCLMVLILNNVHLALLKMLFGSFAATPPQFAWLSKDFYSNLVLLGQNMFEWGVKLAAPAIAIALILDASMGLVAKMVPDFDILFLSLPVRLFLGMAALGVILRYSGWFFERLSAATLRCCSWVIAV